MPNGTAARPAWPAWLPLRPRGAWLATAAAGILAAVAAGFAVAALYLGWREALSAPLAAAATALCLLALAALTHLLAQRRRPPPARSPLPPSPLQAALPLAEIVRGNPRTSLLAALAVGAALEHLERRRR